MAKAILLVTGVLTYLAITKFAYAVAVAQTEEVKKLYTSAMAQAQDISADPR